MIVKVKAPKMGQQFVVETLEALWRLSGWQWMPISLHHLQQRWMARQHAP
jgi:hypothetical protein